MVNGHNGFRSPNHRKSPRGTNPARNIDFDGTKLPIEGCNLRTTTYGMRLLFLAAFDRSHTSLTQHWVSCDDRIQFCQHARDVGLVKLDLEFKTVSVVRIFRDAPCLEVTASVTADRDVQLVLDRTELALIGREGIELLQGVAKIGEISPEETRAVVASKSACGDLDVGVYPICVVISVTRKLLVAIRVWRGFTQNDRDMLKPLPTRTPFMLLLGFAFSRYYEALINTTVSGAYSRRRERLSVKRSYSFSNGRASRNKTVLAGVLS